MLLPVTTRTYAVRAPGPVNGRATHGLTRRPRQRPVCAALARRVCVRVQATAYATFVVVYLAHSLAEDTIKHRKTPVTAHALSMIVGHGNCSLFSWERGHAARACVLAGGTPALPGDCACWRASRPRSQATVRVGGRDARAPRRTMNADDRADSQM